MPAPGRFPRSRPPPPGSLPAPAIRFVPMARCSVAIPVVHVSSAEAAAVFFQSLGFTQTSVYRADGAKPDPAYTLYVRDEAKLHVSSFAGVSGMNIYIWVDDLEALHQEFVGKGIPIIGPFD